MVTINIGREEFMFFAGFVAMMVVGNFVFAYGGNNPPVMGHSFGELEGVQGKLDKACPLGQIVASINPDTGIVTCIVPKIPVLDCNTKIVERIDYGGGCMPPSGPSCDAGFVTVSEFSFPNTGSCTTSVVSCCRLLP